MRKHLLVAVVTLGTTAAFSLPTQAATHASAKVAAATKTANQTKTPPAPKHYAVVAGDNLSQIAQAQGLDSWRPLWNANTSIQDPDLIYPGQDLVIPNTATADRPLPATAHPAALDAAYQSAAQANPRPAVKPAPVYSGDAVAIGRQMNAQRFGDSQWNSLYQLWMHESGWNPNSYNRYSGACGIPQANPCSKISDHSIEGQISWGLNYIASRYGNPDNAWNFWLAHNYY